MSLWAMVIAGSLVVTAACGKRGPPLPPLRPVPNAVGNFTVVRRADSVTLRFTAPAVNADGSEPLVLDRVDLFAVTLAADAKAPTSDELRVSANRVATFTAADLAKTEGIATFTDAVAASNHVRYYVVVPYATRSRAGNASPVVTVALDAAPKPPEGITATYDEHNLTLTWTASEKTGYFVYDTANTTGAPLQAERLTAGKFTQPVAFGTKACFVVRAVEGAAPLSIESAPSEEVCVTPVDTMPPPAPAGLVALAADGAIGLTWDAVTAADLAGYIVLRGEGSSDRLQPLMAAPITASSFDDKTTKPGVKYFYAVVAADTAGNRSKPSNIVEETGR